MKNKYGDADLIDSTEMALKERFAELEKANKALALQVEILSGAYETAQRRVKELEVELNFSRTSFSGLKKLLGTYRDATTANFKIKELEMDKAELLELVKMLLQAESESGQGFCDCIDNNGKYYQSAHLAGILAAMETIVEKNKQ